MPDSVYTVTTTLGPTYQVGQDEFEYLTELGLIGSLGGVTVAVAKVVASPTPPVAPAIGLVWANTSIP